MGKDRGPYKRYLDPNCSPGKRSSTKIRREVVYNAEQRLATLNAWINVGQQNDEVSDQHEEAQVEVDQNEDNLIPAPNENEENGDASDRDNVPDLLAQAGPNLDRNNENDDQQGNISGSESDDASNSSEEEMDPILPSPFLLLKRFMENNSNTVLTVSCNFSEIMLMAISFIISHNLSLTASCELMQMLNIILCTTVFPSTRYIFKRLLNPNAGMKFQYTCENCGHFLGRQGDEHIELCQNCNTTNDLKGYQYEHTFITLDVRSQIREIVEDNIHNIIKDQGIDGIYNDFYSGKIYKKNIPRRDGTLPKKLTISFNCDAAQVSNDGKTSVTPIYLMINELSLAARRKNMILAGLWYGKEKPRMDVFLKPFVDIMNDLRDNGVTVKINGEDKNLKIFTLCCVVDTVARAPMQGIVSVNGYNCCSWCNIVGESVNDTVKYTFCHPESQERTESEYQNCCHEFIRTGRRTLGVQSISPLINLGFFSMIWGFTPDIMHQIMIGIVKRTTDNFITNSQSVFYIGGALLHTLDDRMRSIKIPSILKRFPLPLSKRSFMKAKEYENWLLFFSIPVLSGILPLKYINHWKLLVNAVTILLQNSVSIADIDAAELMLLEFVYKYEEYYGKYEMTYNIHQLLHLAESVRQLGPLWTHTAYPFESVIGRLKHALKAAKGIPHQVVRALELVRATTVIYNELPQLRDDIAKFCDLKSKQRLQNGFKCKNGETILGSGHIYVGQHEGLPADNIVKEYCKVIKEGILYCTRNNQDDIRRDDSFVELNDNSFARIKKILVVNDDIDTKIVYVVLQPLRTNVISGLKHTLMINGKGNTFAFPFSHIKCIAVYVKVGNLEYISSVPSNHYALNM